MVLNYTDLANITSTLPGARAQNYANWLLKQRQSNNRWMTLKDTIASMMSLETYALESLKADENNPTTIKVSTIHCIANCYVVPKQICELFLKFCFSIIVLKGFTV